MRALGKNRLALLRNLGGAEWFSPPDCDRPHLDALVKLGLATRDGAAHYKITRAGRRALTGDAQRSMTAGVREQRRRIHEAKDHAFHTQPALLEAGRAAAVLLTRILDGEPIDPGAREVRRLRTRLSDAIAAAESSGPKVGGRPLGSNQIGVLRSLRDHGAWFYVGTRRCGWVWSNEGGTRRLLDGLVKRGLVQVDREKVYTLTLAGRAMLKACTAADRE